MNDESKKDLLIGMILGQIAALLNHIKTLALTSDQIYENLLDLENGAALQVHELYYKNEAKDDK